MVMRQQLNSCDNLTDNVAGLDICIWWKKILERLNVKSENSDDTANHSKADSEFSLSVNGVLFRFVYCVGIWALS